MVTSLFFWHAISKKKLKKKTKPHMVTDHEVIAKQSLDKGTELGTPCKTERLGCGTPISTILKMAALIS